MYPAAALALVLAFNQPNQCSVWVCAKPAALTKGAPKLRCPGEGTLFGGFSHIESCFASGQRPCETQLAAEHAKKSNDCWLPAAAVGFSAWAASRGRVSARNLGSHGLFLLTRTFWAVFFQLLG